MGLLDRAKHAAERFRGKTNEKAGEHTNDMSKMNKGRMQQSKSDLKDAGDKMKDAGGNVKDSFDR